MFKNNYKKIYDFNDEEYKEYLKRSASYLRGKTLLNSAVFESHFFILMDVLKKRDTRKARAKRYKTKNVYLLKYIEEVVNMYEVQGMGYQSISKALWVNHKVKVSKSTIERFTKDNGLVKNGKS